MSLEEEHAFVSTQMPGVLAHLLPDATTLHLEACHVDTGRAIPARRILCYERTLADLPWADYHAVAAASAEMVLPQLPLPPPYLYRTAAQRGRPWDRRSLRLPQRLVALSLALGVRLGCVLSQHWGLAHDRYSVHDAARPSIDEPGHWR